MTDFEKKRVFKKVIERMHAVAAKLVISQEQRETEGQRIMDALSKRMAK